MVFGGQIQSLFYVFRHLYYMFFCYLCFEQITIHGASAIQLHNWSVTLWSTYLSILDCLLVLVILRKDALERQTTEQI